MKPRLTQKQLKELLVYVPETGLFYWRKRRGAATPGKLAGYSRSLSYSRIRIYGHSYCSHRLAWTYEYGVEPKEIHHRNGNPADNRISNLEEISHSRNAHLTHRPPGASGYRGVWRSRNRWWARITVNRKNIFLGSFKTAEDAARAYDKAALEYYGESAMTNARLYGLPPAGA